MSEGRKKIKLTLEDARRNHNKFMKLLEENPNATDDELDELIIMDAFKSVLEESEGEKDEK